eukprot:scaffold60260_cov67-Phaeocystis_antarctica.AAC.2
MEKKGAREPGLGKCRGKVPRVWSLARGAECGSGAAEGDSLPSRGSAHKWDSDIDSAIWILFGRTLRSLTAQICWCASPCVSACACSAAWDTSRVAACSCSAIAAATTAPTSTRCAFILRVAATAWRTFAPRQSTAMRVAAPTRAFIFTASASF